MKNIFLIFILFLGHLSLAQKTDSITKVFLTTSIDLDTDEFIGADEFDNIYYVKNNTLYKKNDIEILSYSNTQLGSISSVDIKNPLKLLLFYSNFNTVIMLDNKLNALTSSIDFNRDAFSKNISLVSSSSNNNLWLYSRDDDKLYLYNYQTKTIVSDSAPINFYEDNFIPTRMVANYKYCWLINDDVVMKYDEYGNFKQRIVLDNLHLLNWFNGNYYWVREGAIYFSDLENTPSKIMFKNPITIESFYVLNNEIFIFEGEKLFRYKTTKI